MVVARRIRAEDVLDVLAELVVHVIAGLGRRAVGEQVQTAPGEQQRLELPGTAEALQAQGAVLGRAEYRFEETEALKPVEPPAPELKVATVEPASRPCLSHLSAGTERSHDAPRRKNADRSGERPIGGHEPCDDEVSILLPGAKDLNEVGVADGRRVRSCCTRSDALKAHTTSTRSIG